VSWRALENEDFIDFAESWGVRALNDEAFAAHGLHRHVRCTVNDVHTLLDLIARGLGIAIVPRHVASKPQAAPLRALNLPGSNGLAWTVSAVSPAWDRVEAPAAHLLDLLTDLTATVHSPVQGRTGQGGHTSHPQNTASERTQ
jgi:DNA-binding transcriptional LysR family regulator